MQRSFYARNADAFTHKSFLHVNAFAHKNFTQKLIKRRRFYTEKLLNTGASTHILFDTGAFLQTIRNWGTGKNSFVSGRNACVWERTAFVLGQSAGTKIVWPRKPTTNVCFSTELLWLNVCLEKKGGDIIYFHPKIVRDLDVFLCKTGQFSKRTMDVDGKNKYSKITKRAESGIEDQWYRKAFLAGKPEINNM